MRSSTTLKNELRGRAERLLKGKVRVDSSPLAETPKGLVDQKFVDDLWFKVLAPLRDSLFKVSEDLKSFDFSVLFPKEEKVKVELPSLINKVDRGGGRSPDRCPKCGGGFYLKCGHRVCLKCNYVEP